MPVELEGAIRSLRYWMQIFQKSLDKSGWGQTASKFRTTFSAPYRPSQLRILEQISSLFVR
jgi:hypothetical protein